MKRLSRSVPAALLVLATALPAGARIGALAAPAFSNRTAPQHLPYAAIHNPQFVPAAKATWVADDDRVIGLMSGTTPKAYPAGILAQHGLVEDQSPSGPIAVTW